MYGAGGGWPIPVGFWCVHGGGATLAQGTGGGARAFVAAWNAPDEFVVGGPEAALKAITRAMSAHRLSVVGAWHGPYHGRCRRGAAAGHGEGFGGTLRARFVSNGTGDVASVGALTDLLAEQLVRPIRFAQALNRLGALGVTTFVTVGPGAVLRGLVRKNLGASVRVLTTEDCDNFDRTATALAEEPRST